MTASPNLGVATDAVLILAFVEAAEDTPGWLLPLADARHPWRRLYAVVRDAPEGGRAVLAERQALLDRVQWLEKKVARLQAGIPLLAALPVEGDSRC